MALPNQLRGARMSDSTLGNTIDDNVGDLEKALGDLLGIPIDTNISAALFDVVAAGLKKVIFQDAAGDPAAAGQLLRNSKRLKYHDGSVVRTLVTALDVGGEIFGLTLANNGVDAVNDIDIAVGSATDSTQNRVIRLASALTKQLDAVWAVGTNAGMLDTGVIANGTYHLFLIERSDTGVVDILASLSATAPTMPASYDFKRRIGSILRESAAIVTFVQNGDYFQRLVGVLDVNAGDPGTAAVTSTLSVPTGINVIALFNSILISGTPILAVALFSDLASTDVAVTASNGCLAAGNTASEVMAGMFEIRSNTSAQIRRRLSASDAVVTIRIFTVGWIDRRGRDL
jgi:predicted nucleotidyltransferase